MNAIQRAATVAPSPTNKVLNEIEAQLAEFVAAEGKCPTCRQSFQPDGGGLNSETLLHRDDCMLLEIRQMTW